MLEAARRVPRLRGLRIPHWGDYGQAERFAGLLALGGLIAAAPSLVMGRVVIAEVYVGLAVALFACVLASERGAPRWVLGVGTPAAMTVCALALLFLAGGRAVSAAGMLAAAPAVAVLWASAAAGWSFLALAVVSSLFVAGFAPGGVHPGAEPWIAHTIGCFGGTNVS